MLGSPGRGRGIRSRPIRCGCGSVRPARLYGPGGSPGGVVRCSGGRGRGPPPGGGRLSAVRDPLMARLSADRARPEAGSGCPGASHADPVPTGRVDVRHFRRSCAGVAFDPARFGQRVQSRADAGRPLGLGGGLGPRGCPRLLALGFGELFEYWAQWHPGPHRASSAAQMADGGGWHWGRIERMLAERPGFLEAVEAEVAAKGPPPRPSG